MQEKTEEKYQFYHVKKDRSKWCEENVKRRTDKWLQ